MSRLGKKPIDLPQGVKINVSGLTVTVEGPKGKLTRTFPEGVSIKVEDNKVHVSRSADDGPTKAKHGLVRSLLSNMVKGVSEGFSKTLISIGVGYRMAVQGNKVNITAGFSHPVSYDLPKGMTGKVAEQTKLTLTSIDNEELGLVADKIRGIRPPEPYKGKGIRYEGEVIQLKEGKAGAKGAG